MRLCQHLQVLAGVIATLATPLAIRPAQAQSPGGYYYETYRFGYNPGYYSRRYAALPVFVVQSKTTASFAPYVYYLAPSAPIVSRSKRALALEARVLSEAITPAPANASVRIELSVPADAQVWFEGAKTAQTGIQRKFESPPLIPGRQYTYEVRVTWKENGREVTEGRHLTVRAGELVSETFPTVVTRVAATKDARPAQPPITQKSN